MVNLELQVQRRSVKHGAKVTFYICSTARDVKIDLSREECVLGMEQISNCAAMKEHKVFFVSDKSVVFTR